MLQIEKIKEAINSYPLIQRCYVQRDFQGNITGMCILAALLRDTGYDESLINRDLITWLTLGNPKNEVAQALYTNYEITLVIARMIVIKFDDASSVESGKITVLSYLSDIANSANNDYIAEPCQPTQSIQLTVSQQTSQTPMLSTKPWDAYTGSLVTLAVTDESSWISPKAWSSPSGIDYWTKYALVGSITGV